MNQPNLHFSNPLPKAPMHTVKRPSKRIVWWIGGGVLAALLILIMVISWWYSQAVFAPKTASGSLVPVTIESGSTVAQIADQLQSAGLIEHPMLFRWYVRSAGLNNKLQSGSYQLPEHISIQDLAQRLQSAKRDEAVLRFVEGWRREEMADYIQAQHDKGLIDMTGEQFSALALTPNQNLRAILGSAIMADDSLQGFLFPDTYVVNKDETAEKLLTRMLNNYKKKVTPAIVAGFTKQGLREYEAVNLAAIVERESRVGDERAVIAGILLNRLNIGMALGVDATIQYALGYSTTEKKWWRHNLTTEDLAVNSPYNTRLVAGLPPHPISNPSLSSLQAVATPTDTDYLFYIHDSQGVAHYAKTLAEHNANIAKYLR